MKRRVKKRSRPGAPARPAPSLVIAPRQPAQDRFSAQPADLGPAKPVGLSQPELVELAEEAAGLAAKARAGETRRVYRLQWQAFERWASERGLDALPAAPAALVMYLTERQRRAGVSTIAQILAAVALAHRNAGLDSPTKDPTVRQVWEGICRDKGIAPKRQATPLTPEQLRELAAVCSPRDRALLLIGFAAARRRSELVALKLQDVVEEPDGLRITVRKSKTDQLGAGHVIGVPFGSDKLTCPVRALREWLAVRPDWTRASLRTTGAEPEALFLSARGKPLSGEDVTRILRRAAKRAGFNAELINSLSGHSLRSGLATTAAKRGKSAMAIAKQGGWKSLDMVLRYVRDAELFDNNPASGIGL